MKNTSAIRVLIVDDEPLARKKIRRFLKEEADVEVIAECKDGKEAVAVIESKQPDLVFLDIRMPRLNGIAVLETLAPGRMPLVVLVTAYDQYAVKAFEFQALDYLLKPFNRERFQAAMERARKTLRQENADRTAAFQAVLAFLEERKKKTVT
jgi:two-component system LytT family response regulator